MVCGLISVMLKKLPGWIEAHIPPVASLLAHRRWKSRSYSSPLPPDAKRSVLKRYGGASATWIETGTYLGDTTAVLASWSDRVISIEPAPVLYSRAAHRFSAVPSVTIINGTSESTLPRILRDLSGSVSFWLDGHYSGGPTYEGECPLRAELAAIAEHLEHIDHPVLMIDDIRLCSDPAFPDYPSLDELVDWSRANDLRWLIEHDIFVAFR